MNHQRQALPTRASPHSLGNRIGRVLWGTAQSLLVRPSPRVCHRWRNLVLRCFGADLHPTARVYPRARIWAPWNLTMAEHSTIADDVEVYAVARIQIGPASTISQFCHLCAATHDYTVASFPLRPEPISIGGRCWLAAEVFVGPGVTIGDGVVVGVRSTVLGDLPRWTVCAGTPARPIKPRVLRDDA
jgi:putative colanic acid biosynthesis acetyltransferase WcaF